MLNGFKFVNELITVILFVVKNIHRGTFSNSFH